MMEEFGCQSPAHISNMNVQPSHRTHLVRVLEHSGEVSYAELTSGDSKLTVSPGKLSFAQGNGLGPCPL